MDLRIEKIGADSGTMTISTDDVDGLTNSEVIKIYSPVRKKMLKYRQIAPAINLKERGKKDTITVNFLGGDNIDKMVIKSAMDEFGRQLRAYEKSNLPVEKFCSRLKAEYGVGDCDDLETVKPSATWMKRQKRRAEEKIAPKVPPFALRVNS